MASNPLPMGLQMIDPLKQQQPQQQQPQPQQQSLPPSLPGGAPMQPAPAASPGTEVPAGLTPTQDQTQLAPPPTAEPEQELDFAEMEWRDVIKNAGKNLGGSGNQYLKDIWETITHPVETAKAVTGLAAGAAQKLIPGEQAQEKNVDMLVDFVKDRYGSIENLKKTIATDPVGFVADASTFISGGGGAVRGLSKVAKLKRLQALAKTPPPGTKRLGMPGQALDAVDDLAKPGVAGQAVTGLEKIGEAGKKIQQFGSSIEPTTAATKATLWAGEHIPVVGKLTKPAEAYKSAVKFGTTLDEPTRNKLSQLALDEHIMPNEAGLDKLRSKINVVGKEVNDVIDAATESGETINVAALFNDFGDLRKKASASTDAMAAHKKIDSIVSKLANFQIKGGVKKTPRQIQDLKQQIYKELGDIYTKTAEAPIAKQTKKVFAANAKKSLEAMIPELGEMNKRWGNLIELEKALDRPVSRISNRDMIGLGLPAKMGTGAMTGAVAGGGANPITGAAGAALGLASAILDDPIVKSRIAIGLNQLHKNGKVISKQTQNLIEHFNIPVDADIAKTYGLVAAVPERMKPDEE